MARTPPEPAEQVRQFIPAKNTGNRAIRRQLAAEARGKVRPDRRSFRQAMQDAARLRAHQETTTP